MAAQTWLEDAGPGEILRARCDGCGIRSDLARLPVDLPALVELLRGFERGHAGCGLKRKRRKPGCDEVVVASDFNEPPSF